VLHRELIDGHREPRPSLPEAAATQPARKVGR
jgi:hypothetical protein